MACCLIKSKHHDINDHFKHGASQQSEFIVIMKPKRRNEENRKQTPLFDLNGEFV
jgi:hypothetical protein